MCVLLQYIEQLAKAFQYCQVMTVCVVAVHRAAGQGPSVLSGDDCVCLLLQYIEQLAKALQYCQVMTVCVCCCST